ncbi:MAG: SpoIIE family protein phosphatase [Eubacteriales bacterium]|nr:SpoIIE family protein phosphatase [Eubacteriales bacterium]
MLKGKKIKAKLVLTMLILTFSTLMLVYLEMFFAIFYMKNTAETIYHEIAENAEGYTAEALLTEAEEAMMAIVDAEAQATNSRFSSEAGLIEQSADYLKDIYADPGAFTGSYRPVPLNEAPSDKVTARYSVAGGKSLTNRLSRELKSIANIEPLFSSIMRHNPTIDDMYIGTASGILYEYTAENDYSPDYAHTERPWYKKAASNPGSVVWMETYIDPYGKACITAATAVADDSGNVIAVVAADIRFNEIMENLLARGIGKYSTSFLLGENYDLIAYRDIYDEDFDPSFSAHFEDADTVKENLAKRDGRAFFATLDGKEVYMCASRIPVSGWTFCTAADKEQITQPIDAVKAETKDILASAASKTRKAFATLIISVALSFIIVAALSSAIASRFAKSITDPLEKIKEHAAAIGEGNFEQNIVKETEDEIGELAECLDDIQHDLIGYTENLKNVTAEKERISAELSVAANIQASLLPSVFPPFNDVDEIDIYALMDPAKEVGGDFYDFFMPDKYHLAFVVTDVSGKGVPASLFMVKGKTLIKEHTRPDSDLGEVFSTVNDILTESNTEEFFITAYEAVIDLRSGEVRFVNAGHEHPFLMERDESRTAHYTELKPKAGLALAVMEGIHYNAGSFMMRPGDRLFQYTDGVPEASDKTDQLYGMDRLERFLNDHTDMTPQDLLPALREDIEAFADGADQYDDIAMLCFEFVKKM